MTSDQTHQSIINGAASLRTDDMDASAATVLKSYADYAALVETDLNHQVAAARSMGMSWADIGAVFGITRQAAQQRFGKH